MIKKLRISSCVLFGLVHPFFMSSCSYPISGNSAIGYEEKIQVKQLVKEIKVIESRMAEKGTSEWNVTLKDSGLDNARKFFFLDKEHGWAYHDELNKTEDGGQIWKAVKSVKSERSRFSHVFFYDSNLGWVVEQSLFSGPQEAKSQDALVTRTRNGGDTWSEILRLKGIVITDLFFATEDVGWLVGRKYDGEDPIDFEIYTVVTSDGGESWSDVSKGLDTAIGALHESQLRSKNISSVLVHNNEFTVLSGDDQMLHTSDLGQQWNSLGALPHDDLFTRLNTNRMGLLGDRLRWFVRASHHYEALGALTVEGGESWTQYELRDFYFSDGVLLSENEAIVCGYRTRPNHSPTGVILHSLDGGRSWKLLIENSKSVNIERIQVLAGDTILSWDSNGRIYTATRKRV
ncbi:MAG: WD40/YVTN/BNR-like repeat-containing protein [Blastocatellia bacterium]